MFNLLLELSIDPISIENTSIMSRYCEEHKALVKEERKVMALRHYIITGKRTASVPDLFNSRPESVLLLATWNTGLYNNDYSKQILNNINWSKQEYLKQLQMKHKIFTSKKQYLALLTKLIAKMEDGEELETDELVEIGYKSLHLTKLYQSDTLQQMVILPEFTMRLYEQGMYNKVNFKPESLNKFYMLVKDACIDHLVSMKHTGVTLTNLKKKPVPKCSSVQITSASLKYNRLENPFDNHEPQMLHDVLGGTANKSLKLVKRTLSNDKRKVYYSMYLKVYNQDEQSLKPKKYDWGALEIVESFTYCPQCFGFDHDVPHCKGLFEAPPAYDHALAQDTKEKADSESEVDEINPNGTGKSEKRRFRLFRK